MLKESKNHYQHVFNDAVKNLLQEKPGSISSLLKGNPVELIPQYAHKHHIDMLVLGTVSRSGIPGLTIGNTAEDIMQKVSCSLLMVKP